MTKKVAVILSGCGHLDGAEIRESVLTLLYLDEMGAETHIFAPEMKQHDCINHVGGYESNQVRDVIEESARIARGNVKPLDFINVNDFDALIIPGGYGVAKTLSNLAMMGVEARVLPAFKKLIDSFYNAKKPIGAICIAPAVLAIALRGKGIELTIGDDEQTATVIEAMGNVHKAAATDEAVVDANNKIVSCSAYMREDKISNVAKGIRNLVKEVLSLTIEKA